MDGDGLPSYATHISKNQETFLSKFDWLFWSIFVQPGPTAIKIMVMGTKIAGFTFDLHTLEMRICLGVRFFNVWSVWLRLAFGYFSKPRESIVKTKLKISKTSLKMSFHPCWDFSCFFRCKQVPHICMTRLKPKNIDDFTITWPKNEKQLFVETSFRLESAGRSHRL